MPPVGPGDDPRPTSEDKNILCIFLCSGILSWDATCWPRWWPSANVRRHEYSMSACALESYVEMAPVDLGDDPQPTSEDKKPGVCLQDWRTNWISEFAILCCLVCYVYLGKEFYNLGSISSFIESEVYNIYVYIIWQWIVTCIQGSCDSQWCVVLILHTWCLTAMIWW